MQRSLFYAAYGWLVLSGTLLFAIDVLSQHIRGKRAAGFETSLYYGFYTSLAFGQILLGLLCLWLTWKEPMIVSGGPIVGLSLVAAVGWCVIAFLFIEYLEPKITAGIFAFLLVSAMLLSVY